MDALTLLLNAPTNPPTGAIKLVRAPIKLQEWTGSAYADRVLSLAGGGTGGADAVTARANLGLGSMAIQVASAVAITGGTIAGVSLSAAQLTGALPAVNASALTNLNASNISSGTVADARLSANIPKLDAAFNWWAGYHRITNGGTPALPGFGIYNGLHQVSAGIYGEGRSLSLAANSREFIGMYDYRVGDGALGIFFFDRCSFPFATPTALNGVTHNLALTPRATYYRMGATVPVEVTGIIHPSGLGLDGGITFYWWNASSNPITLKNNNAGSLAGNRFLCPGNVDLVLGLFQTAMFAYSGVDAAWVVFDV